MKTYITFLVALAFGSYFLDVYLMDHYQPSVAVLKRTTETSGPLSLIGHRGGWTAYVNGIPLMCTMSYLGGYQPCIERVPGLRSGTPMTVSVASVPAAFGTVQLTLSMTVNGAQIYAATPEQVIQEYTRSSRRSLLMGPFFAVSFVLLLSLVIINLTGFFRSPVV
jgi:hypothetical protein